MVSTRPLESGGEKTQPVSQKQRKDACMAVLLPTIVIAVGGCVWEMGFNGIIGGDHMINNAYAEESVLLVTNETAKLTASDGAGNDFFGSSVSVYNNTAVIGAYGDDDNGSYSAYVFEKNSTSGNWTQTETVKLTASDAAANDLFGISVSVYNNTAVIGASGDDDNGTRSGSAYVFEKNSTSGNWTQTETAKLTASDGAANDLFGRSVSVYNNTAVISAIFDDDNGSYSGSAYVFEKNSTSGNWTQTETVKLTASDGAAGDYFGRSVSVYNNTAVIGASLDDDNGHNSGSAYIFEKNSTGHWTQKQKLLASDGANNDWFGRSVSVYNNTVVIGATYGDDNGSGSAYVFEKNSTSGNWTQTETVKLTASDGAAGDLFGISVSVYNNTAVIGASGDNDNGSYSGSAYIFEKNSTGHWTQKQKLLASDGANNDWFGRSVSVYNNTAVIGAFYDDDNGSNSGSAYVFTILQAPTAHAGDAQTVDEGDNVTLDGTGSADPNGDTITYLWSQTQGPTVTLSSSTSVSPTFDAPLINSTQAILTFSLTVNDGAADSTPDTVDITVSNVNTPPTANAGADQTVDEGDNVTLNGSATDPDTDDTITYAWSQTQGPRVTLSSSTSVSPTFDAPLINSTQAILTFSLTVNDGAADSTPDTVDITVSNVNTPPTANAGADQTVDEGTTDIQLNGSATDPDTDDTITYLWSQTQGPTVTLSSSTSVSPTFDAPLINSTQAILTFSLTVNDGAADSTPDTVDITVSNVNTPPTANAGADQTVDEGDNVTLNGSATDPDTDDTITYAWSQTQGPTVTLSSSTSVSPTFDAPLINSTQAILTFSLTVNDGAADSTPDTVDITVSNVNTPPTANAGADQTVDEGDNVTLNGSATDPDTDDTITYAWSQTQGPTVTLSSSTSVSPTFDAPLINSTQAILTFSLTVNDGAADSTPDTVDITVSNVNTPPTANAGADQTVDEGTTDIQLNGSATDPDTDDTITYLWSQTQGPTVTLSSSTSVSPTFDAPLINSTQAILTFSLTVNDGAADSTPDTVDITVSNVNTPPTANAGADQTVDEGDNVTLNGSATDPDTDDTITYAWSQTQGPTVTLSSSTSVSPTFDAPLINSTQAILTFSLTVNDGAADSTPDTVDITVSNVNTPPTANAGADQTVDEGDNVTLNGSATDPDTDDTITYAWSQTQGPTVTLSSSTSVSPTFDAPLINSTQAILTFSLTVNDGAADSTPDTVDITVSNVNTPPTANAGADQTVDEGTTDIQLNGSATDPDTDDTITYAWSQTQGPTVTLSSSTSVSPTFDAPLINSTQAILTFSLTVNDGAADSTPDTVDITVSNVNTPPTANAGADQTVDEGTTDIQLNGSATDPDTDDTITYAWSQTQGPRVTLSSSTSVSPTFDAPLINSTQAILTFSLTVNDGAADSTPDTVDITVSNVNTPPTANAGADQTVDEGTTDIQLNGSATDPDTDDTITYAWSQTQGPRVTLSSSTSVSPTFDAPAVNSDQTLTFSLTVNDGAVDSTPDTVIVTILDTDGSGVTNQTPTAHAGDDQTVDEGTAEVTLNGSKSSDPDGDTITYLWSQTQGPTVTLSSSTSVSPTFDAPLINSTQAILTFSLTVNDGAVDSTPDTVIVTILDTDGSGVTNQTPTAHAGDDQTVDEGTAEVTLNGSKSSDPDGDTITYLWSQTQGPTVTLSSSTSVSPTFDAPLINSTQAILTFSLTVNDGAADSTPDTVDITVSNVNTPPTANAGADQTVDEGDNVTLDGTGSADPNGDTITYLWSQTQGPTVTLSSSVSASPTFDAPLINSDQAILTFSLTVNDGAVDSTNNDTVIVTILDTDSSDVTNQAPTANAGDPQVVGEGKTVILDGSASTDDKGSGNLRYEWRQDLTDSIQVTLLPETDNPAIVTFDAPADVNSPQILTFILKVIDKEDLSNDARVTVTILDTDAVTPSPGGGSSGGGGGGGGGGGPIRIDNVYIKSVSWDCNAGTIKIIAGPDSDYLSISVRTTQLGAHQASVAGDDIPGYRAFVSNMDKTEDYIGIKAVAPHSRDPATISESINITECTGERIFDEYMQPESTLPSAVTQTEEEVAATQRTEDTPVTEGQKTIFDSPLHQQLKGDIPAEMVQCNEGLVLILKPNMEESACVRESTAHKLVMRGWHGII